MTNLAENLAKARTACAALNSHLHAVRVVSGRNWVAEEYACYSNVQPSEIWADDLADMANQLEERFRLTYPAQAVKSPKAVAAVAALRALSRQARAEKPALESIPE
jgi:hypothetical protein